MSSRRLIDAGFAVETCDGLGDPREEREARRRRLRVIHEYLNMIDPTPLRGGNLHLCRKWIGSHRWTSMIMYME
jgi:hypothetical protein